MRQTLLDIMNVTLIVIILGAGALGILRILAQAWVFINRPRKKW